MCVANPQRSCAPMGRWIDFLQTGYKMLPENSLDEKLDDERMQDSSVEEARPVGGTSSGNPTRPARAGLSLP